jgi:magnesium-transporting ATPase (P-type)
MRKSYSKIRKIAEKTFTVRVLREGIERVINNADLVPGDLYFPDR